MKYAVGEANAEDMAELEARYARTLAKEQKRRDDKGRAERALAPNGWAGKLIAEMDTERPATDDGDERAQRIAHLADKLEEHDEARRLVAERKARALIDVNSDHFMDGWEFVTQIARANALWGDDDGHVLMAPGEGLMIVGPQGVGKSTVAQQFVLARAGLRGDALFGYPVETDDRPILYLAMDRPRQIARSMLRMIDAATDRERLREQLIFWDGRPPIMATKRRKRLRSGLLSTAATPARSLWTR